MGAHRYIRFHSPEALADEEGIPFDQANEQPRGWSRRIRYYICWVSSGLRKKTQEMMARKNGYYEKFIQGLTLADLLPGTLHYWMNYEPLVVSLRSVHLVKNCTVIQRLGIADRLEAIA